jgi:hypothetical protein
MLKGIGISGSGGSGSNGTVTNVATGTGLTGGPITTTGTISIANTAVTAGTYGNSTAVSQITINAQGQITNAASVTIAAGGSGTVTNVATGTGLTGGPVTTTGTISIANTTVTAGTYGGASNTVIVTINAQGQVTNAVNSVITLQNSGVSAGTYGSSSNVAQVTVNAQGIVTSVTNVATGTVTSVATGTGLTGGPISTSGTISIANTAVASGTYGNATTVSQFTVNSQGQLTAAANVIIASVTLGNTALAPGATVSTVGNLTLSNPTLGVANATSINFGGSALGNYVLGTWTPTDASATGNLVFTNVDAEYTRIGNMVFASGHLTYPSTADGSNALIGGLPVTVANRNAALGPSGLYITGIVIGAGGAVVPQANTTRLSLISETIQGPYKNSDLSTATISFLAIYPAT